jgi:hypothetical protein
MKPIRHHWQLDVFSRPVDAALEFRLSLSPGKRENRSPRRRDSRAQKVREVFSANWLVAATTPAIADRFRAVRSRSLSLGERVRVRVSVSTIIPRAGIGTMGNKPKRWVLSKSADL